MNWTSWLCSLSFEAVSRLFNSSPSFPISRRVVRMNWDGADGMLTPCLVWCKHWHVCFLYYPCWWPLLRSPSSFPHALLQAHPCSLFLSLWMLSHLRFSGVLLFGFEVLVSWGCSNITTDWGAKPAEMCSLRVSKAGSLKSRCWQDSSLGCLFLALGGCWQSSFCLFHMAFSLSLSLVLYEHQSLDEGLIQCDLIVS